MEEGIYKVWTSNYVFLLDILTYDSTYTIKYGDVASKEGPCIELTYDTETDFIKIDSLMYDSRCSYKKLLAKGEGTREMLFSILKLCSQTFPNIKRFILNDVSAIVCNGENLYLSYFYLLNHGQTWYEKYFQAKPVKKKIKDKLNAFRTLLSQTPQTGIFSFYDGGGNYVPQWHDYFKTKPCEFFLQHKREIEKVSKVKLVYSEWYIKKEIAQNYDVTIQSITKTKQQTGAGHNFNTQRLTFEDL